jgi:hexosaminidase
MDWRFVEFAREALFHYPAHSPQIRETSSLRTFTALVMLFSIFARSAAAQAQPQLNLMPVPSRVKMGTGQLVIDTLFSVGIDSSDPQLQRAVDLFLQHLRTQTGMSPLDMHVANASQAILTVHAEHASKPVQELGEDESYSLEVTSSSAKLEAPTTLGIMRGLETFLQLVQITPVGFAVPVVSIQDRPRFPWRGLMIDVGRHFIPLDVLKHNLDGMAALKLNVFHWHLSENQGFRVESKKFPKLQEMGSDGLYYTQAEVRELIAYAHDRGIRVVPEFDMPGHSTSWFVGYPDLASAPGPYQIERKWGIFDPAMDPTEERTYKFLDQFIGEMAALFPDRYFHIGGDEVNAKQWDANPKIQAFMRAHDIKTNQDLQAYFTRRVQKIVSKHGKIMIGWDEVLRPELPKDVVVQVWHGHAFLADAVRRGYPTIFSEGYYLDLNWPAARHYGVDPLSDEAASLTPEERQRVLGGEACMWSEYVSAENIDSRIWPRLAAIAERLWSPPGVNDIASMYERLEVTSRWLDWLGLTHNSSYAPMLRRIAGSDGISSLRTLANVVEPVKDYTREETAAVPATSLDPLNRLIDAVRPESTAARTFAAEVNLLLSAKASPETKQQVRASLLRWRDSQAKLQPLESQSFLLKEVVPLSQELSDVATIGLQALDYLEGPVRAPGGWQAQQLARLKHAEEPKAQLLLMVVPSVEKLVEATGKQTTADR